MTFTLIAILTGITTGLSNPDVQSLHQGGPACNNLNDILYKATNNTCNIYAQDRITCIEKFEKVLLEPSLVHTFVQAQQACKDEISEERPEALLKQFKAEHKKEKYKCKRKDLNRDEKYTCKQRPIDIKMLEEKIQRRKS